MITVNLGQSGEIVKGHQGWGEEAFSQYLNTHYRFVEEVEATNEDLHKCYNILGRRVPNAFALKAHVFLGDNAKEIARNWFAEPCDI